MMVQRREMTKTAVTLQGIKHDPPTSKAVWAIAILVVDGGEVRSKLVRLQVGSGYTLEMYDGVLT